MADFASMLKYLREREGLSQRELASRLGMSASAIGMYESGKRHPKYEDEETIADFFNVDLNTLRGRRIFENGDDLKNTLTDLYMANNEAKLSKALDLYEAFNNATPDVQKAVEILLKGQKSDS